jgi:hypothetical protein
VKNLFFHNVRRDRRVTEECYKHCTGGEQWEWKRGWMSAATLSKWQGVTVNSSGRVTRLELYENNLCGIISLMELLQAMMI